MRACLLNPLFVVVEELMLEASDVREDEGVSDLGAGVDASLVRAEKSM